MSSPARPVKLLKGLSIVLWLALVLLPLSALFVGALSSSAGSDVTGPVMASLLRSLLLAGGIAALAVILGWLPGRLLGTSRTHGVVLLLLILMPLVLPRYVLYYAWTLLLSPTTSLGRILASRPALARPIGTLTSTAVLVGWHWPLAALVLGQGWRGLDGHLWECASLEAKPRQVFRYVTVPLLGRSILLAFGVCFVLALSEFATFHLAGVETVGTELAVLYELTGSSGAAARAAWPVMGLAVVAAVVLSRASGQWASKSVTLTAVRARTNRSAWAVLGLLLLVSLAAPVILLVVNVTDLTPFRQFVTLHSDDLGWSLATAALAAVLAGLIALGGLHLGDQRDRGALRSTLRHILGVTIYLAMFLPASLVAVSLVKLLSVSGLTAVRQSWLLVSAGQASRFAGLASILLLLTRYPDRRTLTEMASLDGASDVQTWWHIHLRRTWPIWIGTFLLVTMFCLTELSATMVLLPAGLPNFAQRLLNQMHYARDQQVIASCLILVGLFLMLSIVVVLLFHAGRVRKTLVVSLFSLVILGMSGCDGNDRADGQPAVINAFGQTGAGEGEFLYPRAIDLAPDGSLLVADKSGRIQRLTSEGRCLNVTQMPMLKAGKPTGVSVHADGRFFVADTHYHRVLVFSPEGAVVDEFGRYGQEDGCFIYPTDVAFAEDGRIFVSEYGGNDRISVFTSAGEFIMTFGTPGMGEGQFSRPSALCLDESRDRLYVADACNHRIAIYSLAGQLAGYIGSVGLEPGQLRYPYDLVVLTDGTLVVCEFGNNRIQLFSPEGRSLAVYGQAGRQLGQLAYPWAVAVDAQRRAYVVDAGNNRIQVWQL